MQVLYSLLARPLFRRPLHFLFSLPMTGILYLIPTLLSPPEASSETQLAWSVPPHVQKLTATLDYFIAENAKSTRAYLKVVASQIPLATTLQQILINELNVNTPPARLPELLAPILAGRNAGLISEAGVPAVADPGADLVRLAHRSGIVVQPMVGPSSILLAVMASGLSGQSFAFNGYLPLDAAQRSKRIKLLEDRSRTEQQTQLFIETPYRNRALLDALLATCQPETLLSMAIDLTTPAEHICTRTISQWKQLVQKAQLPDFQKKPAVFLMLAP